MTTSSRHISALDGLRGVAILMVIFWHFIVCKIQAPGGTAAGYFYKISHHAYSGVDLFFVLSGFLITGILFDSVKNPGWLCNFWIRRIFRIFPLYFLYLGIVISLNLAQGRDGVAIMAAPASWWPYFLMLQNIQMADANSLGSWGITWSLAIEEQFYIIFPLLICFVSARRYLPILCMIAIGLSMALRLQEGGHSLSSFVLTPYRLYGLAMGAFCAWLVKNPSLWIKFQERPWIANSMVLLGLVLLSLITIRTQQRAPIDHLVFAFAYGSLLLLVVVRQQSVLAVLLSRPTLYFFGAISYPLYLFHELCDWAINQALPNSTNSVLWILMITLLSTLLSVVVATILNNLIGTPMVRIGRRLAEE